MNIYVIYLDGTVYTVTTLPRIVIEALKGREGKVELWRNEKLIRTFTSGRDFNRFLNPPRSEDDENGGSEYEW